jgi:hypothetical protein
MVPNAAEFFAELDALGEDAVRARLAQKVYNREKERLVQEWLRRREVTRADGLRRSEQEQKAAEHKLQRGVHAATWVSSVVSIVALLVSAGSFYFSYLAYQESHREPLLLRATRSTRDYATKLDPSPLPPLGSADLITYWEILLANNGQQTVSVLSLDVRLLAPGRVIYYSGFVNSILDDQLRPTDPPWSVDPGKTLTLAARLKLHVNPKAYQQLRLAFPNGELPSLHRAEFLLADHELDFWGDSIHPFRAEGGVVGFRVESDSNQPTVGFIVRSARGTVVSDSASWYSSRGQ